MTEKAAEVVQVNLRIPQSLRRKLVAEARRSKRSFNAELVHRLQGSFAYQAITTNEAIAEAVELTLQRLGITSKKGQR